MNFISDAFYNEIPSYEDTFALLDAIESWRDKPERWHIEHNFEELEAAAIARDLLRDPIDDMVRNIHDILYPRTDYASRLNRIHGHPTILKP